MKKLTYKIHTLGCKVNQYDSGVLSTKLLDLGFIRTSSGADLVICNTCAVTKRAIQKAQRVIKQVKKENPSAKIFLVGCWPKIYGEEIESSDFDLVCGVNEINSIIDKVKSIFSLDDNLKVGLLSNTDRARYIIKVQDGCEQFCSYCIIPYTRGKLKSRNSEDVLTEIKGALKHGYHEIVISGIHLGLYGTDLGNKYSLIDLLQNIVLLSGEFRVRLSSIEVTEVSDELIELIAKNDKICNHLHIPLQSGSDKILKAMNRPYSLEFFNEVVLKIRNMIPGAAISTDVIVGFPDETDDDFANTKKFVKQISFSKLHVFPFSIHEKTPAAKMKNKINTTIIKERAKELRNIGADSTEKYIKTFFGKKLLVLIERVGKDFSVGKSEYYFDINIKTRKNIKRGELTLAELIK
jgi:threonylcarbamoyladenosine tRNA methylthiotransferase MtaB